MTHVIDVRQAGGDLVVLGAFVTLPSGTGASQPLHGSLRYNRATGEVEVFRPVTSPSGSVRSLWERPASTDVAQRFHADAVYGVGTVLVVGGTAEVTASTIENDNRIVGVVSARTTSEDGTHPLIALDGRTPCRVVGPVTRGALLVTSGTPGHAMATDYPAPFTVIGRALQSCGVGNHTIDVVLA